MYRKLSGRFGLAIIVGIGCGLAAGAMLFGITASVATVAGLEISLFLVLLGGVATVRRDFLRRVSVVAWAAVALGFLGSSYAYSQIICTQDCKEVNITAYYDTTVTPAKKTCWSYRWGAISCWICGNGSAGGGYCLNGNSTLDCKAQESDPPDYEKGSCLLICENMEKTDNNFQEAIGFHFGDGIWRSETLYKCKKKDSK